jgi:hypothetical protein
VAIRALATFGLAKMGSDCSRAAVVPGCRWRLPLAAAATELAVFAAAPRLWFPPGSGQFSFSAGGYYLDLAP